MEQVVDRLNHPELHLRLNGDEIQVAGQKVVSRRRRSAQWSRVRIARAHGYGPRTVGRQTVDPIATPGQTEVHARRVGLGAHRTEPADYAHFVLRDDHDPCEHVGSQGDRSQPGCQAAHSHGRASFAGSRRGVELAPARTAPATAGLLAGPGVASGTPWVRTFRKALSADKTSVVF